MHVSLLSLYDNEDVAAEVNVRGVVEHSTTDDNVNNAPQDKHDTGMLQVTEKVSIITSIWFNFLNNGLLGFREIITSMITKYFV